MRVLGTAILVGMVVAGCASQQQQLAERQPTAIDAALRRGRFELECPAATATVLSQDYIEPAVEGPLLAGQTRLEYTIGVEGCARRATYIVICQAGTGSCFASGDRERWRER